MTIPSGADARLNVGVPGGRSGSAKVLVTTKVLSSSILKSAGTLRTGALLFTSSTMTVKLLRSPKGGEPLSVTCTPMTLVLGPWASVGVQLNTPVFGLRITPLGAAVRLKLRWGAGRSESVAVFVTRSVVNSLIRRLAGTVSTGGMKFRSL